VDFDLRFAHHRPQQCQGNMAICIKCIHIVWTHVHLTCSNKSSAVAKMGDRGHNRHGPKRGAGGCCAPFAKSWDPVQYNVAWAEVYFRTKWRLHPSSRLATIDMNRKLVAVPLLGRATTPSNTMSPGPMFTSVASGTFIHPAILPQ